MTPRYAKTLELSRLANTAEKAVPKRRGRPPGSGGPRLAHADATKPRSVRLNDARWAKLQRLGRDWLEGAIDRARAPPDSTRKSE